MLSVSSGNRIDERSTPLVTAGNCIIKKLVLYLSVETKRGNKMLRLDRLKCVMKDASSYKNCKI
jgi:hypothetical protein